MTRRMELPPALIVVPEDPLSDTGLIRMLMQGVATVDLQNHLDCATAHIVRVGRHW